MNKKEVVVEVTGSTSPKYAPMSTYAWSNKSHFKLQSEEVESEEISGVVSTGGSEVTSQTVSFVDNAEGEIMMAASSLNAVARVDNTDDLSLGSFLARPTVISSFTWSTSDTVGVKQTIQPWQLFLANPRIRKKIDNFAFFRGKMHIKVVINGTPFQYGLMRACYSPLLGLVQDKIRTTDSPQPLLIPYSQQPGFFLTPAANAGGQMELPFFRHTNWLDMTSNTDVGNMGTINFVIYAPLGVAVTGGTSTVSVQVFAWATEVELMGTTMRLTLQGDEYGQGSVSKVATAVANFASYLTHIPRIGPFARATEIGATAVGTIARMFGYTNVPVIADVHAFMPQNAPMLASAHIGTPVQKLTLDPKQELSIDPSLHGLGPEDELALPYIFGKESYFGATSWSTSDAVDTLLFNMRVTPCLSGNSVILDSTDDPVGTRIYHTPTSYVAQMFLNWRGSLIVRFKIVATKFHKGRLKISYDPRGDISATNPDINEVYTQIVDIGEEDDIELEIPYHQEWPWLYLDGTPGINWTPGATLNRRSSLDNGVLTVRVLTTLQAPTSGTVNVLAFVRGGHDLEYANPKSNIGYESVSPVPSFFELQAEDVTNIVPKKYIVGTPSVPHPERYSQNFGEAIGSLRTLVHRYQTQDTVQLTGAISNGTTIFRKDFKQMPPTPGFDPSWSSLTQANKVVAATGTANYYYGQMVHLPYVAGMFLGYRGGVNYCVTPSVDLTNGISDIRVVRMTRQTNVANGRWFSVLQSVADSASASAKAYALNWVNGLSQSMAGLAITSSVTNNSIMFQLPDFKLANFSLSSKNFFNLGAGTDGTDRIGASLHLVFRKQTGFGDINVQTQIAAAPDWTCHFWLCCPTLDYLDGNPIPV